MSPLRVPGDPVGLRAAAASLRALARGIDDDRQRFHATASAVTDCGQGWSGRGADAFMADVASKAAPFTALVEGCERSAAALEAYARALEGAQQEAALLAERAAALGLRVDEGGAVALAPVVAAPGSPPREVPPEAGALQSQAMDLLDGLEEAAARCQRELDAAREGLPSEFRWYVPPYDAGNLVGYAHALATAGPNAREGMDAWFRTRHGKGETRAYWGRAQRFRNAAGRWGAKSELLKRLNYSFGDLAASGNSWLKWGSAPGLKRVPFVGIGATGVSIISEINSGKSPTASITTNVSGLVAGSVAGVWSAGLTAGGLAAAGVVAAPALPIVAGAVVGIGVGVAVSKAGEWFFEHTDVGRGIARTVDNAVGGAAKAVGNFAGGLFD